MSTMEISPQPDLWETRDYLKTIRDVSHARMVSPWAVLGAVIINTVTRIPYHLALPPLIGGRASLNMHLAMVGRSGSGKGSAMNVADQLMPVNIGPRVPIGSGEGLVATFGQQRTDDGQTYFDYANANHAAQFLETEVTGLIAQSRRQGSTLTGQLLKMYSGEALGFAYKGANAVVIDGMSYRGCFIVHVQPELASGLLGAANSGFPQRFLWVAANNPHAPEPNDWSPQAITALPFPSFPSIIPETVDLPAEATTMVRETAHRALTGTGQGLDGHTLQTRLKVAVALAALDGRPVTVNREDWRLAGKIMVHSQQVRDYCAEVLEAERTEAMRTEGAARGAGDVAREESRERERLEGVKQQIIDVVKSKDGRTTEGYFNRAVTRARRELIQPALEDLEAGGVISRQGNSVVLLGWQP